MFRYFENALIPIVSIRKPTRHRPGCGRFCVDIAGRFTVFWR